MRGGSRITAILCDLDGTLLDTVPDIADAVNAVLAELGREPVSEQAVTGYVGRGVDVLLHRVLTGDRDGRADALLHRHARSLFDAAYAAVNGRRSRLYPGVVEGLDAFRALGIRLACVTNKPQTPADAVLAHFGIADRFEFVLGGEALPQRKPQPEPMWHAARRLDASPRTAMALGDSANDARAARAAGMAVALVDYGYTEGRPISEIDCDAVISSFTELSAALGGNGDARFGFLKRESMHDA